MHIDAVLLRALNQCFQEEGVSLVRTASSHSTNPPCRVCTDGDAHAQVTAVEPAFNRLGLFDQMRVRARRSPRSSRRSTGWCCSTRACRTACGRCRARATRGRGAWSSPAGSQSRRPSSQVRSRGPAPLQHPAQSASRLKSTSWKPTAQAMCMWCRAFFTGACNILCWPIPHAHSTSSVSASW